MCMLPSEEAASFSSLAWVSSRAVAFLSNSDLASFSLANAASARPRRLAWGTCTYNVQTGKGEGVYPKRRGCVNSAVPNADKIQNP